MTEPKLAPGAADEAQRAGHVLQRARCAHCDAELELECEPLSGFYGYRTYNEYFCPRCRKQNHARTTGAIVAARLAGHARRP
jgi:hypothetical protein